MSAVQVKIDAGTAEQLRRAGVKPGDTVHSKGEGAPYVVERFDPDALVFVIRPVEPERTVADAEWADEMQAELDRLRK